MGHLKFVNLGTVEPRKHYGAAVAILDEIRPSFDPSAELHIIGRAGRGDAVISAIAPISSVFGLYRRPARSIPSH